MSQVNAKRRQFLRLACILCALSILLMLLPSCDWNGSDVPSDEAVRQAARAFAKALKNAGSDADEILEAAREEAKKWGPKAQLFIETVIEELKK